jgi:trans-aconitate methyltransferase
VFESPNTLRFEKLFEEVILTNAPGKRVLEIGCGDGTVAERIFRSHPSYMMGIDISRKFITRAKQREQKGKLEFVLGDVSQPMDSRFDLIFGRSILHHLDYRRTLKTLYASNLVDGGVMAFMEPLGGNPLIKLYHAISNAHTPDEKSFKREDLNWFRGSFQEVSIHPINLFSFPCALISSYVLSSADNSLLRLTDKLDVWIAKRVKSLIPYFRHVVLIIRKPSPS